MGLNPNKKIAVSNGIDLPILYVYLAGRICGEHIDLCMGWRNEIIKHYKNWKLATPEKGEKWIYESYPIAFISPLNSGEADSVDKKGLTSKIPPNLIYDKDLLSVQKADVVIANMDDFFETDIQGLLRDDIGFAEAEELEDAFSLLQQKILNRRENMGTIFEIAWAMLLQKPIILIVPERRRENYELHPFTKRASVIVTSVKQLLEEKHLQTLYKAIAGA